MEHYIRYFAATGDTPAAAFAFEYIKAFMRMGPRVRLCSMSGWMVGPWQYLAALTQTEMRGTMINVVCCEPDRWTWHVPIPKRGANEIETDDEVTDSRCELYTVGVRNVLIATAKAEKPHEIATALKYQVLIVPDQELADFWRAAGGNPQVVPRPAADYLELQRAVMA